MILSTKTSGEKFLNYSVLLANINTLFFLYKNKLRFKIAKEQWKFKNKQWRKDEAQENFIHSYKRKRV